jgi:radical SAM-linked protein
MDLFTRRKKLEETLPWSFIETSIQPTFLWEEFQKGLKEEISPACWGDDCHRCGICNGKTVRIIDKHSDGIRPIERMGRVGTPKRTKEKVRLRFTKKGDIRFISHLELAHLFYRASKRADLSLRHSEGFHPMPKIIFATALPVGVESLTEIVDMELESRIIPSQVMERLNQTLPLGIKIIEAEEVSLSSSLSSLLHRSVYWIPLDHLLSKEEAIANIKRALEKRDFFLHQERKGKKRRVDIRPLIERMDVKERSSDWGVELVLRGVVGRTAKPSEVVEAILGLKGENLSRCKIVKIE